MLLRHLRLFTCRASTTYSPRRMLSLSSIPAGAWDSHMHVFDPAAIPPSDNPRAYVPPEATAEQACQALLAVTPRMCVVQPSIYGTDNSVTLKGLADIQKGGGGHGCAVVELDPATTSSEEIQKLHDAGARGVRVNFVSRGIKPAREQLMAQMQAYADLLRPWGWVLQIYINLSLLDDIGDQLDSFGVPVCIDHFGQPDLRHADEVEDIPGYRSLLRAYGAKGSTLYVKISGAYRLTPTPQLDDPKLALLERMFSDLANLSTERIVFASDWPHTRFEGVDTQGWTRKVIEWCAAWGKESDPQAGQELLTKLFMTNADRLWSASDRVPS